VNVIRAEEMGMGFGGRDALKIADSIRDPSRVTIHGELAHNPEVTRRLAEAAGIPGPKCSCPRPALQCKVCPDWPRARSGSRPGLRIGS